MIPHEILVSIRNIMLMQLVLVLAAQSAIGARRELARFRRSILAPFLREKEPTRKESFWEIDMTRFEP